ncbi:MAG TPA: NfeD family protein [Methylophilaceae bacterium]|nr:NfeD family protein [Methylophilaceae bacterium]
MLESLWAWGILGLILLTIEMISGTFYILWFAIAALCMSVALVLLPGMPVALQFLLFAVLSLGSLAIWKLTYKPASPHLRVGQSHGDEIGRVGTIIEPVSARQNGKIRFAQGVMGSREWVAIADEDINAGADAIITGIEGNALRVQRKPS